MQEYSLSDLATATGGKSGAFGGCDSWVLILLFAMIFGGNGFGFGGNNAVQQGDLQRAIDLNSIQNGQRDIEARVQEVGAELGTSIKDVAYNNLSEIRDVQSVVNAGFANMQNCCCGLDKSIMENRYLAERNTAAITSAIQADGEATRNMLYQNKIDALTAQVSELKTQNMFCGIPRINPYMYGIQPNCGCNCGGLN